MIRGGQRITAQHGRSERKCRVDGKKRSQQCGDAGRQHRADRRLMRHSFKNDTWRFNPVGSSAQNPSHTYTTPGTYSVALQAYNAGGYNSTRKAGYITITGSALEDALDNPSLTVTTGGDSPWFVDPGDFTTEPAESGRRRRPGKSRGSRPRSTGRLSSILTGRRQRTGEILPGILMVTNGLTQR